MVAQLDKEKAIDKIKKCFNLAKNNTNENEIAIALKQAHILMKKYNVDYADLDANPIAITASKYAYNRKTWKKFLLNTIAQYCVVIPVHHGKNFVWTGASVNVEMAEYIYGYLYRLCSEARNEHMTNHLSRVKKKANKTSRGDEFAFGWCLGVRIAIEDVLNANQDDIHALKVKVAKQIKTKDVDPQKMRKKLEECLHKSGSDMDYGAAKGRQVKILKPLAPSKQSTLFLE